MYFRINCNIFSYDYSGYGVSGGKPSEKNLYADIEVSLFKHKTKRWFVLPFSTSSRGEPFYSCTPHHQAAWHAMRTKLGISPENIILYGQSIGTVPTVDLASRFEVSLQFTINFGGMISSYIWDYSLGFLIQLWDWSHKVREKILWGWSHRY